MREEFRYLFLPEDLNEKLFKVDASFLRRFPPSELFSQFRWAFIKKKGEKSIFGYVFRSSFLSGQETEFRSKNSWVRLYNFSEDDYIFKILKALYSDLKDDPDFYVDSLDRDDYSRKIIFQSSKIPKNPFIFDLLYSLSFHGKKLEWELCMIPGSGEGVYLIIQLLHSLSKSSSNFLIKRAPDDPNAFYFYPLGREFSWISIRLEKLSDFSILKEFLQNLIKVSGFFKSLLSGKKLSNEEKLKEICLNFLVYLKLNDLLKEGDF